MIQNEKQYKITCKRLTEIDEAIVKAKAGNDTDITKKQSYLNALAYQQGIMKDEVREYEKTKNKGITLKRKISITRLPDILIQYKISKKLSQKAFSAILGIKEQQLQRYEAEQYASVSFRRLMEFVEKTNLNITVAIEENT